jgi:hypothetical protein
MRLDVTALHISRKITLCLLICDQIFYPLGIWFVSVHLLVYKSSMIPVVPCISIQSLNNFYKYITPWEADYSSDNQTFLLLLRTPLLCVHRRPSLDPILYQTDSVPFLKFHFLNVHFNIVLPSLSRPSKLSHWFGISENCFVLSSRILRMLDVHQSYRPWSGKSNNKWGTSSICNIF